MAWSADGRHILVIELNWRTPIKELVSYPAGGGEPVRRTIDNYQGLWLSPDGKQVATMRPEWHEQVWALDNVLPEGVARKK